MQHEITEKIRILKEYGGIPEIFCYPSELNQVFMSVLTNAIQALDGEGKISIKTYEHEDTVQIEIADSGRGMPEDKLDRLFDLNFTRKGSRIAVGMGLPGAYNIIQKHSGNLTVNSEFGKGTTVSITLPKDLKD
jgi:signal transduction histidine kinase